MRNGEDEQAAKVSPTPRELCSLGFQYCSQGDFGRAEAVYREAAAKGYANAQYNLAVLIKKKLSTSRALKAKRTSIEAAGWFSEAALQGHARAAKTAAVAGRERAQRRATVPRRISGHARGRLQDAQARAAVARCVENQLRRATRPGSMPWDSLVYSRTAAVPRIGWCAWTGT